MFGSLKCSLKFPTSDSVQGSLGALVSRADSQEQSRKPVELCPGFRRCLLKHKCFIRMFWMLLGKHTASSLQGLCYNWLG